MHQIISLLLHLVVPIRAPLKFLYAGFSDVKPVSEEIIRAINCPEDISKENNAQDDQIDRHIFAIKYKAVFHTELRIILIGSAPKSGSIKNRLTIFFDKI